MQIKDIDFNLVEQILLGEGHFNDKQRSFIELNESKTIIAGPGAGKTTALAAKITLLLKDLRMSNCKEGVCIITHTNVAVSEINKVLDISGIGKIEHPHFIGTIHEFFNRFCVIPFFKYKFKTNSLIIDKEHKSDLDYYKAFLGRTYNWMNQQKFIPVRDAISKRIHDSELIFDKENNTVDLYNSTNWDKFEKYKTKMLDAKYSRKKQGFLTHNDTFLFSNLFLLENRFKKILRDRFKYIFLDEFQDTTPIGSELLENLFGTRDSIYLKIGDPYQTINYNQLMPDIEEELIFKMNITNRFGNEIAKHLNVIMPDANIQAYSWRKSISPVILLYNNKEDIYPEYKKLIKECEWLDSTFKASTKEDKVLVLRKSWSSKVKKGVPYSEKKKVTLKSLNVILKTLILDFIVKKIAINEMNISDAKLWINNYPKLEQLNIILIKLIKSGLTSTCKSTLKIWINELLSERNVAQININNSIFHQIKETILNPHSFKKTNNTDDIFTIHSVKGETLRSVLLVDFQEKPLTNILLHRYGINENDDYLQTHHNLLYVAMSRVTHLFAFAMHLDDWSRINKESLEADWIIRNPKVNKDIT